MWFWPFGWIFFALFATFLLVRLALFWRWRGAWRAGWGCYGAMPAGAVDAESILKRRLASGEIDESAYERLLERMRK